MYGRTLKKHIGTTLLSIIIVVILFYVNEVISVYIGDKIGKILIGVFLVAVIVNIIKWLAVFVVRFIWKTSVISFEKAINKTSHFKCTDESSQFLVKIGALFSITEATLDKHNKGEKNKKGFINCLEVRDYNSKDEKEMILASLGASWNIANKNQLYATLEQLMDKNNFLDIDFDINKNKWFEKILKKHNLQFENLKNKKSSKHIAAFNIQRAVLLLREALTCDLINLEELEEFKPKVHNLINEEFTSIEDFIIDYLIGVCYFYEEKIVFGPVMINERVNGVKTLIENDYFNKDLNTL
ncbi:DUF1266 domain-containing protein [Clostridium botulinum]|uniref:DUF1266 domain-containing protein n=1 Tax=Clostridium botulinum TaxID=1491 RepID=A0A6B4JJX3_CLOBO|nr:DUF1266 domain-containing protein [Clostridium botulinum]EES49111.1 hypothetical protein CLO_0973 [Clostridium botulinum E1 str. 'BoNT E Beluga']MBY6760141.1 DUF1266 domain-containing protein [Clostridium botulinum]MBY6919050.1 DUF1266 domain-containing protein [Clostridium botulinum]MCR1132227.1 DUF1266 domain-containing protein [Clostridium botulinum]NFJ57306.1 DUF1266 domain-containing protein [Clostridium botulinum]